MRIVVVHTHAHSRARWVEELRARLPDAQVNAWPPGETRTDSEAPPASGGQGPDDSDVGDADYAVGWAPPEDFFARQPRLRAFFSAAAGVDHLLRHPGLPAGLPIVRLEDAGMGAQMAEYCLHEVYGAWQRRHEYAAQQREAAWQVLRTPRRSEYPVGVLGLGVLGAQVARTLAGFGYTVNGFSRTPKTIEGVRGFAGGDDALEAFLRASRALVALAPLTADTTDLLDRRRLSWLQPGGWVINVARGPLIVDADLIALIDEGHLAGATLDVFREEPLPASHPFWRHPRIRITPHVSALTLIGLSAEQVAAKLARMARGETVGGLVDRARGY